MLWLWIVYVCLFLFYDHSLTKHRSTATVTSTISPRWASLCCTASRKWTVTQLHGRWCMRSRYQTWFDSQFFPFPFYYFRFWFIRVYDIHIALGLAFILSFLYIFFCFFFIYTQLDLVHLLLFHTIQYRFLPSFFSHIARYQGIFYYLCL